MAKHRYSHEEYEKHKEKRLEYQRGYYKKKRLEEGFISRASANIKKTTRNLRQAVLDLLGRRCAVCGFDDERALQIDHINGGGGREVKSMGTYSMYKKILEEDGEGYQVLCANHNWIKRVERGEKRDARKDRGT